jgi:glycosyltransferase involved in cell wall biosynthesis
MEITVVTIVKNECELLPFFVRHYRQFADRIVVYDESDDETPVIAERMGCEVIAMEHGNGIRDDIHAEIKSQAGGKFGGDWTMVPDVDEFLYHPDMRQLLGDYKIHGVTLPRVEGYAMIGDRILSDGYLTDQLRYGMTDPIYGKRIVYRSDTRLTYRPGAHKVQAQIDVHSKNADIKLLHYKFAFGWEWLQARIERVMLSPENIANGWGAQIRDIEAYRRKYQYIAAHKQQVI